MLKTPAIKICGITCPNMALDAAQLGVQYIGLVFCPSSPRYVSVQQAQRIVQALAATDCKPVAVFAECTSDDILNTLKATKIKTVQLHDKQAKQALKQLPRGVNKIYALSIDATGHIIDHNSADLALLNPQRDHLLFDGELAGSGQTMPYSTAQRLNQLPFFLAGGLHADNVRAAIEQAQPDGVDVSSGVEVQRGQKCLQRINTFVEQVKARSYVTV